MGNIEIDMFTDGGTIFIKRECVELYINFRVNSPDKGALYDQYPSSEIEPIDKITSDQLLLLTDVIVKQFHDRINSENSNRELIRSMHKVLIKSTN